MGILDITQQLASAPLGSRPDTSDQRNPFAGSTRFRSLSEREVRFIALLNYLHAFHYQTTRRILHASMRISIEFIITNIRRLHSEGWEGK